LKIKKKIFYWAPFLTPIATPKAVINSAYSLQKYSNEFDCSIINFFGEFNIFKKDIVNKNIKIYNSSFNILRKYLPFKGKIKSRFSFLIIFILSFLPLRKLLSEERPDYLIVQLITSLPMFLVLIFNFNTKFILRISGIPRVSFFRKLLWKIALKKFYLITCPTESTMQYIKSLNIVDDDKIKVLFDPIIEVKKIKSETNKKNNTISHNNYCLAVGRLTKQKNFIFLCKAFKKVVTKYPNAKLLIAGDGEDKEKIDSYIIKNKLEENIITLGYIKNIFPLMYGAKLFILSSLWEDPGFVLIEASFCRTPTLTSNCKTGPIELIKDKKNGLVFESNNLESFFKKFEEFNKIEKISDLKLNNLRMIKKFTLFQHYKSFNRMLSY
jgi:glycosyltransferase involved in cell wall biosynthesis